MLTATGALLYQKEENMEKKDLKKLLASLGIASLISAGGSMAIPGIATGSGWAGTDKSAGSAENAATDTTKSAIQEVKTTAEETVDTAEEAVDKTEEAVDKAVDEVKKKAGDSGWGASK